MLLEIRQLRICCAGLDFRFSSPGQWLNPLRVLRAGASRPGKLSFYHHDKKIAGSPVSGCAAIIFLMMVLAERKIRFKPVLRPANNFQSRAERLVYRQICRV